MEMKTTQKNLKFNSNNYSNIFNYYDNGFYEFLKVASKSKIPKKLKFRTKNSYFISSQNAIKIKTYIDNIGIKYKGKQLNNLFLKNPQQIQNILNYK
jgi:hypothetical protein